MTDTIPYGRQWIDEDDIRSVVEVLQSDWITTGPMIGRFERAVCEYTGASHAAALSSGTAALHAAVYAAGIGKGDEVIVPPITFAATANAVVYQGGVPVFSDVEPDTLLIDSSLVEEKITKRTKAIIAVDYAGHPCDYDALRSIAERHRLVLISDACHALGATYKGKKTGELADLTVFSFHPVKHITTGEGGMVVTNDPQLAERIRIFRNHGISTDHRLRQEKGTWFYEMVDLGYNYRITDFQCALGISQLSKLGGWIKRRNDLASFYGYAFSDTPEVKSLAIRPWATHAYHLYVVFLALESLTVGRDEIFSTLRADNIGVNVHYIPVYLHPFYRDHFGTKEGLCPAAERGFERIITLPLFHGLTEGDARRVVESVKGAIARYRK